MGRRVYVRAVLDLDRLVRRLHQPPKLPLYIRLRDDHIAKLVDGRIGRVVPRGKVAVVDAFAIPTRIRRRVRCKPKLPELQIPRLETRQTVLLALVEPKVAARPEQADMTEPLALWNGGQSRIETEDVESCASRSAPVLLATRSCMGTYHNHSRRTGASPRHGPSSGRPHSEAALPSANAARWIESRTHAPRMGTVYLLDRSHSQRVSEVGDLLNDE